jgi:hypothetical protein
VVLVNGSAGVAKNFCALELATTSALQAISARRRALRGMDSEDSGPGPHEKRATKAFTVNTCRESLVVM